MPAQAVIKNVRISPRKVGEVAALVRGRTVQDALVILDHTPRRAAKDVKEAIKSASSNADRNHNFKPETLVISQIMVTPGPRLKRFRPVAHGRALRYQHPSSHIRVIVDGDQRPARKPIVSKETKS